MRDPPVAPAPPAEPRELLSEERALDFCAIAPGVPLERGPLNLEQPARSQPAVLPGSIDVFVLSGLAADARGNRLGRGRGHYDATLAQAPRATRIALLRDAALVPAVPVGEHDQPLDAICTERQLILCPRARRENAST